MSKVPVRILAALGLAVLLYPSSAVLLADGSSDFNSCVMACNETRKICGDRCTVDCKELFPGTQNKARRDACIASCKEQCTAISDDCKLNCKEEPSPDAP